MNVPDSPSELLKKVSEARAREVFAEEYEQFTESMRAMADLLLSMGAIDRLSDESIREMLIVMFAFWRDCNQARFQENNKVGGDNREVMRSAQIDQFINSTVVTLTSLRNLTDDKFHIAIEDEPDGS